jgi:large subunit ribosomal protein L25
MQVIKLAIEPRTETGKGAARRLRRSGMAPAVLYREGKEPFMFSFDPEEFEIDLRKKGDRNAIFEISVGGETRICLIKDFQRHPLTRRIRHMDFYEVLPDAAVVVKVRIEPVGRAEGTRLGGQLNVLRRTLDVRCLPAHIPGSIIVDVTPLKVGDFVRVAEIEAPENTEILFESNFNVITVIGKRLGEEEAEVEEEGAEDEASEAPAEA